MFFYCREVTPAPSMHLHIGAGASHVKFMLMTKIYYRTAIGGSYMHTLIWLRRSGWIDARTY